MIIIYYEYLGTIKHTEEEWCQVIEELQFNDSRKNFFYQSKF